MTVPTPLMFLFLTAYPSFAGVAVGTPWPNLAPHDSVDVLSAEAPVSMLLLTDQDGETHEHPIDATLDLLEGETLDVPPGLWAQATIVLDGPIRIHGAVPQAGTFDLTVEIGAIFLEMPSPIDTGSAVPTAMHLGQIDWLTADVINSYAVDHLVVDATHPLHDELRNAFRYGSRWE